MSKGRLIEATFIRQLQDEVTRLTRRIERYQHHARLHKRRIAALKEEIARRERDHDTTSRG